PDAARPLRARRQRRHAPAARHPQRDRSINDTVDHTGDRAMTGPIVAQVREMVARLHSELPRNGLVVWTAGNVSARVPGCELMVIKPTGVSYEDLTADSMVVCDLQGVLVDGDLVPSSDTAAHAYVYRARPDVGGVVHTHSPYATAWAARGEAI